MVEEKGCPSSKDAEVMAALLHLYENPDRYPGLYNYAKALEGIESGETGRLLPNHLHIFVD